MHAILDHTMIRVEDLDASLAFYTDQFGYEELGRWEADTFTNVYLQAPDAHEEGAFLELTYNHDGRSYEMGDAWGHIALRVEDVYEAYEELMDGGVDDYRDPDSCGGRYAFVKDPDGHEVELVRREQGPTWSLDHVMMRVEDADAAIGFWTRKFEYEHAGRWEADSFANYFMVPPEAGEEAIAVELTYNYDGRSYEFGEAWDHVGIRVDDLDEAWETMQVREAPTVHDPQDAGVYEARVSDPDGHGVQLFE